MYQKLLEADETDTTESISIYILETSVVHSIVASNRGQDKNSEIKICEIFYCVRQTELWIWI